MENHIKIVDFDQYCDKCRYYTPDVFGNEEPCYECLANPTNVDSRRPVKYEKK